MDNKEKDIVQDSKTEEQQHHHSHHHHDFPFRHDFLRHQPRDADWCDLEESARDWWVERTWHHG